jgi:hypothetical protein
MTAEIRPMFSYPNKAVVGKLHEELAELIADTRFDNLSVAEIVGCLEFVKWNLINRCD